jgi:hypothetical protein
VVFSRELELAAQLYFPGGRYLTVFTFFVAWSASSGRGGFFGCIGRAVA